MKPMTSALFAGAVLLVVANMMETDGSVSKMAELEKGDLRNRAQTETVGEFTPASQLGPDAGKPVSDEDDAGRDIESSDETSTDPAIGAAMPSIGEFSWADDAEGENPGANIPTTSERRNARELQPGEVTDNFDPTVR